MVGPLLLLGVAAILSSALPSQDRQPAAPRKAEHVVQYSARLNLSSRSDIDQRLHARFAEGTAHRTGSNTCVELLARCDPNSQRDCPGQSSAISEREFQAQKSTLADCLTLQALQHAASATSSHVARLKWDEHILPLLPPQFAISVSVESMRKAEAAARRGQSWSDFDKSGTAATDGVDQIVVRGEGFLERLILWGRGDFNGDGVEDLLVQSLDTLTEGTYRNTRL